MVLSLIRGGYSYYIRCTLIVLLSTTICLTLVVFSCIVSIFTIQLFITPRLMLSKKILSLTLWSLINADYHFILLLKLSGLTLFTTPTFILSLCAVNNASHHYMLLFIKPDVKL